MNDRVLHDQQEVADSLRRSMRSGAFNPNAGLQPLESATKTLEPEKLLGLFDNPIDLVEGVPDRILIPVYLTVSSVGTQPYNLAGDVNVLWGNPDWTGLLVISSLQGLLGGAIGLDGGGIDWFVAPTQALVGSRSELGGFPISLIGTGANPENGDLRLSVTTVYLSV